MSKQFAKLSIIQNSPVTGAPFSALPSLLAAPSAAASLAGVLGDIFDFLMGFVGFFEIDFGLELEFFRLFELHFE